MTIADTLVGATDNSNLRSRCRSHRLLLSYWAYIRRLHASHPTACRILR